jgi:hypothetical protein
VVDLAPHDVPFTLDLGDPARALALVADALPMAPACWEAGHVVAARAVLARGEGAGLAAAVLAVAPRAVGGLWLRAGPGVARDRWLAELGDRINLAAVLHLGSMAASGA